MSAHFFSRDDGARTTPITRRRPTLACHRCRTRRVKCDRKVPVCGNCAKGGHACFQAANSTSSTAPPHLVPGFKRESVERDRLSKLEEEVERLSREVNSHSPGAISQEDSPIDSTEPSAKALQGMVVSMPQTGYFSPFSWAAVTDELADMEHILGTPEGLVSPTVDSTNLQSTSIHRMQQARPSISEELSSILIQLYVRRVHPLVRLIHLPSFYSQLESYKLRSLSSQSSSPSQGRAKMPEGRVSAPQNIHQHQTRSNSPRRESNQAFEVLLSSIYYAALSTVMGDPNGPYLGKDVDVPGLAASFQRDITTKMAPLADIDIFKYGGTLEMLQSVVLMLSVQPISTNARTQWMILGSATRMSQAIGLHRDPIQYGLRPVEVELRRRIWAQICWLDVRLAEELGCEPTVSIGTYDTCLPLSITDEELTQLETNSLSEDRTFLGSSRTNLSIQPHQTLADSQQHHSPFTLMTFSLIMFEDCRVRGRLCLTRYQPKDSIFLGAVGQPKRMWNMGLSNSSLTEKSSWVNHLEEKLEQVYRLQSLDPADPLQSLVARLARLNVTKARFFLKLQRWKEAVPSMDPVEREQEMNKLLRDAIAISTQTIEIFYDPRLSDFFWYMVRVRDVYTTSFILFNLACGRTLGSADIQAAIQVLERLFPRDVYSKDIPLHYRSPMGRLIAMAKARRGSGSARIPVTDARNLSSPAFAQQPLQAPATVTTIPPGSAEGGYMPAHAPLMGTMFEDLDFMMQDPYWPETVDPELYSNDSLGHWGGKQ